MKTAKKPTPKRKRPKRPKRPKMTDKDRADLLARSQATATVRSNLRKMIDVDLWEESSSGELVIRHNGTTYWALRIHTCGADSKRAYGARLLHRPEYGWGSRRTGGKSLFRYDGKYSQEGAALDEPKAERLIAEAEADFRTMVDTQTKEAREKALARKKGNAIQRGVDAGCRALKGLDPCCGEPTVFDIDPDCEDGPAGTMAVFDRANSYKRHHVAVTFASAGEARAFFDRLELYFQLQVRKPVEGEEEDWDE